MKRMKALLGVVLCIALVLSLSLTAFAAGNGGKIIVAEPGNHTYQIYKLFDASKNGTKYTYNCNDTTLEGYINDPDTGFHDLIIDPTTKEVTKTSTYSAAEFAAWLADLEEATPNKLAALKVKADQTSANMAAGVEVDDSGYYFITYDNNRPYALTTVYGADVQIQNKHDTPFDKDVYKAASERTAGTPSHDEKSVQLGDTLFYQITGKVVDTTTNTQYNYLVWDRLGEGLKLVNNTVKVYVAELDSDGAPKLDTKTEITVFAHDTLNETPITSTPKDTIWENTTGTYDDVKPSFVVNIDMNRLNNGTPAYNSNYAIIIEYEALVTEDLGVLVNTAHLVSNDLIKDAQTQNYVSQIVVDKFETGNASQKLAGAKFILQNNITGDAGKDLYYQVTWTAPTDAAAYAADPANYTGTFQAPAAVVGELPANFDWALATDVNWVAENQATVMVTKTDGSAVFSGLKDGDYKLHETQAPDGYVRLDTPVELTVNGKASLDPKNVVDDNPTATAANQAVQLRNVSHVGNTPGSVLPSTGGRGTTMLYMAGLGMMLAAGAFLIFRRRAEAGK